MRRLNLRLLAMVLVGGAVLAAGVYVVHGIQLRRNAEFFLQEARKAKKAGQWQEAQRNYGTYLRFMPGDLDAKEELGYCLADMKLYRRAFEMFERLLRQDPNRRSVRLRLVKVAMQLGRYGDASQHLKGFLLKETPEDGVLLDLLGQCQEAVGEYDAATDSYKSAIKYTPQHLESFAHLATLLRRNLRDPDQADKQMQKLVEANPESIEAYLLRGGYRRTAGELEAEAGRRDPALKLLAGAAEDANEALRRLTATPGETSEEAQRTAQNASALLLAAQCALRQGMLAEDDARRTKDFDAARQYAQRGVAAIPWYAPLYAMLAEVEVNAGRRGEAVAWLERGLKEVPDPQHGDLAWALANLLIDDQKIEGVLREIERLNKLEYQPPLVGYLEGRLQYAQGLWPDCAETFERIRPQLLPWPRLAQQADYWLGSCYGRLGRPDKQLTAFRRAIAVGRLWMPVRQGLVSALIAAGRIDEAIEELRNLLADPRVLKDPQVQVSSRLQLARLSILRNLRLNPAERNWEEVNRDLELLARAVPDLVQVPILQAEALVARNRFEEARKLLLEVRVKHPQELDLWVALASLAQREQKWDAVEQILAEAEQRFPGRVSLRLVRARYFVLRFGKDAAGRLAEIAKKVETEQLSDEDFRQLTFGLALLSFQAGDFPLCRTLAQRLSRRAPQDLQVRLLLFDLAVQGFQLAVQGKDDAAIEAGLEEMETSLGEILQVEKQGPLWHYGWAIYWRLASQSAKAREKDPEELLNRGLEHVAQARARRPGWSRLPLLAAEIYERQAELATEARRGDKLDLAIQNYLTAIDFGERNMTAVRRVVQLLNQRQRYNEIDRVLRKLEEQQTPFSSDLAKMAAEVSLQLDYLDRALEIARSVAAGSKQADDHRWCGMLLSLMGQRAVADLQTARAKDMLAEAEKEFRTAIQLAEQMPENWIALVQFLGRTGQAQRAEAVIAEVQKKIPASQAAFVVSRCYEAIGRVLGAGDESGKHYLAEAEKKYLAALQASPNDPVLVRAMIEFYLRSNKYAQAEPLLNRVVSGEVKAEASDLVFARRNLALVLVMRGDLNLNRAKALIEENLKADSPAPQDRRVQAMVLGSYPDRLWRKKAVTIWEELLHEPQSTYVDDQFALAQLHLALGNRSEAAARMRSVLSGRGGSEPRYLVAHLRALLDREELGEAELWLGRLETAAPGAFIVTDLRAQMLLKRCLKREGGSGGRASPPAAGAPPGVTYDQVINELKTFIDRPGAQPTDPLERVRLVAEKLGEIGRTLKNEGKSAAGRFAAEAEALFRQYVEKHPERSFVLARFLGRQGRLDEALGLVEAAWSKESAPAVTEALISLMSGTAGSLPQRRRIEALLSAALEKFQRPIPLVLVWAEFLSAQQDFERVEAAYREVLQKSPDSFLALNNLAMLLAMQKKKLDEAEQLVIRAIELAGSMPVLLDTRAAVYAAQGKHDQALAVLADAESERPEAVAYFHQAQLHLLKGEREAAVKALKRAQQFGLKPEQLHPLERGAYEKMLELIQSVST